MKVRQGRAHEGSPPARPRGLLAGFGDLSRGKLFPSEVTFPKNKKGASLFPPFPRRTSRTPGVFHPLAQGWRLRRLPWVFVLTPINPGGVVSFRSRPCGIPTFKTAGNLFWEDSPTRVFGESALPFGVFLRSNLNYCRITPPAGIWRWRRARDSGRRF
jgi:hypothetical protein